MAVGTAATAYASRVKTKIGSIVKMNVRKENYESRVRF
jgi:hypothetical protein